MVTMEMIQFLALDLPIQPFMVATAMISISSGGTINGGAGIDNLSHLGGNYPNIANMCTLLMLTWILELILLLNH